MDVVEGAASLFGSEEVNSDPFALLGDNPSPHTPGESTPGYLSSGSTEGVEEPHPVETQQFYQASEVHQRPHGEQYLPDVGWKKSRGNYGQQYYENQTFNASQIDSYSDSPSYNSYAPTSVHASSETVSYSQPVQYSQLDYSTYSQSDYSSVVQPDLQSNVAPYNKYASPSINYDSYFPVGKSVQPVPPSLVQAAAPVTRPKISNAYDPPFPTMGASSRRAAWNRTGALQSIPSTHGSSQMPLQHSPPKSKFDHVRYENGIEYSQTNPPNVGAEYGLSLLHTHDKDYLNRHNDNTTQPLFAEDLLGGSSDHIPLQQTTLSDIQAGAVFASRDVGGTQSVIRDSKEYTTPDSDISLTASPLLVDSEKVHYAESLQYHPQSIASYTEATVQPTSPPPSLSETFSSHNSFGVIAEDLSKPYSSSDISYDPYSETVNEYTSSSHQGNEKVSSDPYVPNRTGQMYKTTSPTSSPPSLPSNSSTIYSLNQIRNVPPKDQMSHGSLPSIYDDPYTPGHTSILPPQESQSKNSWHRGSPQQDFVKQTYIAPYAPSPSLMGANDPLGRTSSKVPVFSFGFGGKLVTCFHGTASLNTGFDVALSSRNSTGVHIRALKNVILDTALDSPGEDFPGPLISDSGAPASGIVRPGAAAQMKNKKSAVIKYLEDLSLEISQGLAYLHSGSSERWHSEDKLVLVNVLKAIVEHDGRLLVTAQSEKTVRLALVPQYEEIIGRSSDDAIGVSVPVYSPLHVDKQTLNSDTSASLFGAVSLGSNTEVPLTVTTLLPSALDRIEKFLLCGERQKAYHYALDEKLWAHAMVIASSIDKEAWKEVVDEFLKTELRLKDTVSHHVKDRNGLRVAYSLFSGQGAAAVQELIPQNLLTRTSSLLQPLTFSQFTPRTPSFTQQAPVVIPVESLSGWAETVSMIISSPVSAETSAALTALGDHLLLGQRVEAAHVCYLLSPQTSPMGYGGSNRFCLVGSRGLQSPTFAKDVDSLIFSEIIEFALSLPPAVKGQESYLGLPHLQAYRFMRAMSFAEIGNINLAQRYCDSIMASLARPSPYFTTALLEQLKGLSDRIHGVSHGDKSGSWIGGKISKPSLDTIGGWLETRFTKLVAGDTDGVLDSQEDISKKPETHSFSGPFSHYSTISTTPSARSSPQPMIPNLNSLPTRTGSAMAYTHYSLDKSIAPSDFSKQQYPHALPTSHFAPQSSSAGQTSDSYSSGISSEELQTQTPRPSESLEGVSQEATWWGSTSFADGSSTQTPTASNFNQGDHTASATSEGYTNYNQYVNEKSSRNDNIQNHVTGEEDEEDLGLGNSKRNKEALVDRQAPVVDTTSSPASTSDKSDTPQQDAKDSASSGSWLSRWWKRDTSTPGPIKASLGEESAFYYDKDLKKWVNKNSSADDTAKALPPPPPSRAQTASPGMANARATIPKPSPQPPVRSASAIDPSRSALRVRSNLIPPPDSAPSTPTGTRLVPQGPSPGRPKSQASKRNVRSRYVDVFQQEQQG